MRHAGSRRWLLGIAVMAAAACGREAAPDPTADEELLTTLEELGREANQRGDPDASTAYSGAAMALRLGIRPTALHIEVDGRSEPYLGFVHMAVRSTAPRSIELRTLVAFRSTQRPDRILYLATMADSAALGRPTATLEWRADLQQLAWASWQDLEARELWVATEGKAGVALAGLGSACPKLSSRAPVECTTGTFDVMLRGTFQRARTGERGAIDPASSRVIATRAAEVNGAVLEF